jgi:acid phosphatase type 7
MTDLAPGETVFYRVGSPLDGWSSVYSFVATRTDFSDGPMRIGVFGDLGWQNAQSLPYLQTEVANGAFDFVIHVGDFAYDLDDNDGQVGDSFMDSIEPISSSVP